jgi:hypothetical protein
MPSINYTVVPLSFNSNGTPRYRAQVQRKGTVYQDDIINRMIKGTTLTRPDALAMSDALITAYIEFLLDGFWINTPLVNCKLSIRGGFDSAADSYLVGRNLTVATFSPGSAMRTIGDLVSVTKDEHVKLSPNPIQLLDPNNLETENVLTPGQTGTLSGRRMAFDPTDPEQGVFLIAADESKIRIELYAKISPAEVIFVVPSGLTPAEYELEVRARVNDEPKIRRGLLDQLVAVP